MAQYRLTYNLTRDNLLPVEDTTRKRSICQKVESLLLFLVN